MSLSFIQPHIIERLISGSFVPARRNQSGPLRLETLAGVSERRDTLSPLAVTKRCVRYEPYVFYNRRDSILTLVEALNTPQKKILMLGGPHGCGKTSLARGVVELMGAGREQLLWFDVNLHTDVESVIDFLLQYVTFIASALETPGRTSPASAFSIDRKSKAFPNNALGNDPLAKLEHLLNAMADVPLLLVIDNTEHLVDREFRLHAPALKEMLNYLLSFPNVKMLLMGERLPYADLAHSPDVLAEVRLSGLSEDSVCSILSQTLARHPAHQQPLADEALYTRLYRATQGFSWLVRTLLYLARHNPDALIRLDHKLQHNNDPLLLGDSVADTQDPRVVEAIGRFLYERLSLTEQRAAQLLAFPRHPMDRKTLLATTRACRLDVTEESLDSLERGFIRPMLRKTYPPQLVLAQLRQPQTERLAEVVSPWYELYRPMKKVIYDQTDEEERIRLHQQLQGFYQQERETPASQRVYAVSDRALGQEMRYHRHAARNRRVLRMQELKASSAAGSVAPAPEDFGARSYLSQYTSSLESNRRWTLDTYRRLELPHPATPPKGAASTHPALDTTYGDWPESAIQLTDEEKSLLLLDANPLPTETTLPQPDAADGASTAQASISQARNSQAPTSQVPTAQARTAAEGLQQALAGISRSASPLAGDSTADPQENALHQLLAQAVMNHDHNRMRDSLLQLARHRMGRGDFTEAETCLNKILSLELAPTPESRATVHQLLGKLYQETYRHNQAIRQFQQVIREGAQETDIGSDSLTALKAQAYLQWADIETFREQPQAAIAHLKQALALEAQLGDPANQAEIYFKLAQAHDSLRETEFALQYYQKALMLDEALGNSLACASTLANLGSIELEREDYQTAGRHFQRSLEYDRRAQNPEGQFKTLGLLALAFWGLGAWQRVEHTYRQALALAIAENRPTWKATAYLKLGDFYQFIRQQTEAAQQYYQMALESGAQELSESSQALLHKRLDALSDKFS
ncbi:MAG: tetratricopeptide repeat protein [Candidatus Melainabacteria bacterium]|nr:tetratricopeptide repeat protein [Candidatus Melainabacteria bacterium]